MPSRFHSALIILFAFIASCRSSPDKEPENRQLMGTGFGIQSATLIVNDLDSTRNYFVDVLGFNLPACEKFEKGMYEGTVSAAFYAPNFTAFELLGIRDTAIVRSKDSFITSFANRYEGVRLYSISTSSTDTTRKWINSRGLKTDSVVSGRARPETPKGWDWDDGGAQWRSLAFNNKNPPAYLPVFTELASFPYHELQDAYRPYSWRKYYDSNANGALGISLLRVVVRDLELARKEFKKIGFKETRVSDTTAAYQLPHNQELQLIAPKKSDNELTKFLETRGPGVYAIGFEVLNLKATREFLTKKLPAKAFIYDTAHKRLLVKKEYAHGVQLEFVQESDEQAALARTYSFKDGVKLDTASVRYAKTIYTKYCALCHGNDRQGYAADHAPSLRSKSLMLTTQQPASAHNFLSHTIKYGRTGTAMAPYAKLQGGPLDEEDIELLILWLHESSGVTKPIEMSPNPITGNVALGKKLYAKHCASCHGTNGEGIHAPALANPLFLATASDAFIHYAITNGRDSTPMKAFRDSLSKMEINALTAYIRTRASGWNAPEAVVMKTPLAKDYILNPSHKAPAFTLREDRYVPAVQVMNALKDSARMILLDARSEAAWHQTHIPGAISVPYYKEPEKFIKDIPNDSTWVVVYCACPHAASMRVVNTLKRYGYKHTAIIDEGILVWAQLGYPVQFGNPGNISTHK